jgi:hypothetical protein
MKRFYLDGTDPLDRRMVETPPDAEIPGAFMYVEDHEKAIAHHDREIIERNRIIAEKSAEIECLRGALQGLVALCEAAGFPCDKARAVLDDTVQPTAEPQSAEEPR